MSDALALRDKLIDAVIQREGGFVDHPDDRGGATRFGIIESVARLHNYNGAMSVMPRSVAVEIYRWDYWNPARCDRIADMLPPATLSLAELIFDEAVNSGVGSVGVSLQIALNALNRQQRDYPDIAVDGGIGRETTAALEKFIAARKSAGVENLAFIITSMRMTRIIFRSQPSDSLAVFSKAIAKEQEGQESFMNGLANRVRDIYKSAK